MLSGIPENGTRLTNTRREYTPLKINSSVPNTIKTNGDISKDPRKTNIKSAINTHAVCAFRDDKRNPVSHRTIGYMRQKWKRYDPKKATPAPFTPNESTNTQVNVRLASVQATSTTINSNWRFLATMMKPMGQVTVRIAIPRQIHRRISTAFTNSEL